MNYLRLLYDIARDLVAILIAAIVGVIVAPIAIVLWLADEGETETVAGEAQSVRLTKS